MCACLWKRNGSCVSVSISTWTDDHPHSSHGCLAEWNVLSMGVYVSQGQDARMAVKCFLLWDLWRLSHPYHCWVDLWGASWLLTHSHLSFMHRWAYLRVVELNWRPAKLGSFYLSQQISGCLFCLVFVELSFISHLALLWKKPLAYFTGKRQTRNAWQYSQR